MSGAIGLFADLVNPIIGFLSLVTLCLLALLYRHARRLPRRLLDVLQAAAREIGAVVEPPTPMALLYALRKRGEGDDELVVGRLGGIIDNEDKFQPDFHLDRIRHVQEITRTLIEIFPILGILGTVCAMAGAVGLQQGTDAAAAGAALGRIVELFGIAIHSTVYGIGAGILFMILHALIGPRLDSSVRQAEEYREWITQARHQVASRRTA